MELSITAATTTRDNESAEMRRARSNNFVNKTLSAAQFFEIFYKFEHKCLVITTVIKELCFAKVSSKQLV